jgi:hypothetical protein
MNALQAIVGGPLNEDLQALADQLVAVGPNTIGVFESVVSEVEAYDPTLLRSWQQEGFASKAAMHCIRYVLPCSELLAAQGKNPFDTVLAAELLCNVAWRAFDNCVDGHEPAKSAHLKSAVAGFRVIDYAERRYSLNVTEDVRQHYEVMNEAAVREGDDAIQLDDIWKRCSIFMLPFERLVPLRPASVSLFRQYINYAGLIHDLHDLISDMSCGTVSLPVKWFREANQSGILDARTVNGLYERARHEVLTLESNFAEADVQNRLPIMSYFLREAVEFLKRG